MPSIDLRSTAQNSVPSTAQDLAQSAVPNAVASAAQPAPPSSSRRDHDLAALHAESSLASAIHPASSAAPSEPAPLLAASPLLDYRHPALSALIDARGWRDLPEYARIGAVYAFVRDDIAFGYNAADDLPASQVLADGIGQCNTKGTLLMALLRAVGIPCRFHGFTIDKALQHGAITGIAYLLAPRSIIHSWVEVWHGGRWINLEGFILDVPYLSALQQRFRHHAGPFCGFGAATPDLQQPGVDWCGTDTYIQKDGINHDFGIFDTPDVFYARHGSNLSGWKKWVYGQLVRHWMNRTVAAIRSGQGLPPPAGLPPAQGSQARGA